MTDDEHSIHEFPVTGEEVAALVRRGFVVQCSFGSRLRLWLDLSTPQGAAQGEALLEIRGAA